MDNDQLKAIENSESNKRSLSAINFVILLIFALIMWTVDADFSLFIFLCAAGMGLYLGWKVVAYRRQSTISRPQVLTTQSSKYDDRPISEILPQFINLNEPENDEVNGYPIYPHAREAIKATGRVLDKSQPLPVDLGLLVYRGDSKLTIYRTMDIPEDAHHIQPYVQLHVPLSLLKSAVGNIQFEIRNHHHQLLFTHRQDYPLNNGLNIITPPARLPIDKVNDFGGTWSVRLNLGNTLIADYTFEWGNASAGVSGVFVADGEINETLRKMLEQQFVQPLTIDDLLAQQEDESSGEQKSSSG